MILDAAIIPRCNPPKIEVLGLMEEGVNGEDSGLALLRYALHG